jgi:hypothetical protein
LFVTIAFKRGYGEGGEKLILMVANRDHFGAITQCCDCSWDCVVIDKYERLHIAEVGRGEKEGSLEGTKKTSVNGVFIFQPSL